MVKEKAKETLNKVSAKAKDLKIKEKLEKIASGMPEELRKRVGSALILIPAVLFFIYFSSSLFSLLVLTVAIWMTYEWVDITEKSKDKMFWRLTGLAYVLAPSFSLLVIRNMDNGADIILWLFMVVWATDIAAYFVGCNLKGPKLAPKISPNKTWSGLIGGICASMLIGLIASLMFKETALFFIAFSGVLAVVAQMGDLLESKVKRIFNIKDSGTLIPGHGGIMDRIDGLTLTAPFVMIIAVLSKSVF
jgi:phosphatidate cytidylyltransferase